MPSKKIVKRIEQILEAHNLTDYTGKIMSFIDFSRIDSDFHPEKYSPAAFLYIYPHHVLLYNDCLEDFYEYPFFEHSVLHEGFHAESYHLSASKNLLNQAFSSNGKREAFILLSEIYAEKRTCSILGRSGIDFHKSKIKRLTDKFCPAEPENIWASFENYAADFAFQNGMVFSSFKNILYIIIGAQTYFRESGLEGWDIDFTAGVKKFSYEAVNFHKSLYRFIKMKTDEIFKKENIIVLTKDIYRINKLCRKFGRQNES